MPAKIAALKIIDTTKNDAVVHHTVPPSNIVSSNLPLLAYFEKTWTGTPIGATRQLTPDFPILMWNTLERSAAGSTGYLYYKRLGSLPPRLQRADILPSPIYMEVPGLPEEPAGSHSQHGSSFRPRPSEAARNTRIVNLISCYTRATADSFLRGIAFNYMS